VSPGLPGALAARAGESAFRGSIFRSSYEIFFTPIPATAKRAAKSIIDVGCDRLGDAAGAGLIRVLIMALPAASSRAILVGAAGCSALAMVFASRLHRGYVRTLEHNLLGREVDIDLSSVDDLTTRTVMLRTLPEADLRTLLAAATEGDEGTTWAVAQASPQPASPQPASAQPASARPTPPAVSQTQDRELEQIVALRSRDAARIRSVLSTIDAPSAAVVAQVIPLLAWDAVASDAIVALRRSSAGHTGLLVDALIDPGQPFAVRRRVARVFSAWSSQRAVDGVVLGLADARFEVRFHCARSLLTIAGAAPGVAIPEPTIHAAVLREVSVGRPVWESNRLLGELDDGDAHPIDQFLRDRAGRSLQHVFTLLSLILPARPLAIAFRGLHTDDQELKGTALEYLEGVLPPDIREHLWPFLEDTRPAERRARSRDQILSDLMRSYDSIALNLDQVQQKAASATPEDR
jgi:AAA family ATP:ADP antiporter